MIWRCENTKLTAGNLKREAQRRRRRFTRCLQSGKHRNHQLSCLSTRDLHICWCRCCSRDILEHIPASVLALPSIRFFIFYSKEGYVCVCVWIDWMCVCVSYRLILSRRPIIYNLFSPCYYPFCSWWKRCPALLWPQRVCLSVGAFSYERARVNTCVSLSPPEERGVRTLMTVLCFLLSESLLFMLAMTA